MIAAPAGIGPAPAWTAVELFTGEQRLSCRMLIRGRLRERLLDTEPSITVHDVTTVASRKTIPHLSGLPEGVLRRDHVVAFWTADGEPPDPDQVATVARPVLIVGPEWTASGTAQLPAGADREQHLNVIQKNPWCRLSQVTLVADWDGAASTWSVAEAYVNLGLANAIYLG